MLYSATGGAWINPQVVTISFMPDGTSLGNGTTSNLFSTFNKNPYLAGRWENQILQAAQVWAKQTNINLVVVPDDGAPEGGGNYQEGDPGMGDIRIGGYNFESSTLAWTNLPPSINNFSIAGDMEFNTGAAWNIGQTYDLATVAMHEFGHALGLGESSTSASNAMYPVYNGIKKGLAADDIVGIDSLYGGARAPDAYAGLNATVLTAANLDSLINPSTLTALAYNLDIANLGQPEFFSVDTPAGMSGPMEVSVQSQGLSLLSPKVTVYASDMQTIVGSANGLGQYGTTLNVTLPNAVAGQRYYIEVQGADTSVFSTGDYALGLSFNGTTPPTEASPIIAYPNGTPLHAGGGQAQYGFGLSGSTPAITGIGPDNGLSNSDGITDVNRISISGTALSGETVTVYDNGSPIGTTTANSSNTWTFNNTGTALPDGTYAITATATDPYGNVSPFSLPYAVMIDTAPTPAPIVTGISPGTMTGTTITTTSANPFAFGTAQPYSQVTFYWGSTAIGSTTTNADGDWNFSTPLASLGIGGTYAITAQATDVAGSVSGPSATYSVSLLPPPWSAPAATVSSASLTAASILSTNPDGSFNTVATPSLSGTATANSQVVVIEDGLIIGIASVNSAGNWSFSSPALTPGRHRLSFEAVNQAGVFSIAVDPITIQV